LSSCVDFCDVYVNLPWWHLCGRALHLFIDSLQSRAVAVALRAVGFAPKACVGFAFKRG